MRTNILHFVYAAHENVDIKMFVCVSGSWRVFTDICCALSSYIDTLSQCVVDVLLVTFTLFCSQDTLCP